MQRLACLALITCGKVRDSAVPSILLEKTRFKAASSCHQRVCARTAKRLRIHQDSILWAV